jgi:catechol 2,3-dioxygenase
MALSWSHSVLFVKNMCEMREFYTRVLGFQVTDEGSIPGNKNIVFLSQQPNEHHQLGLIGPRENEGPPTTLAHFAFRVESMAELRDVIGRVENEGLNYRPTSHGNTWSIYFQDPEGNGIEIFHNTPWHVQQPQGKVWDTSLSDQELHAWTERTFQNEPLFGPRENYEEDRRKKLSSN